MTFIIGCTVTEIFSVTVAFIDNINSIYVEYDIYRSPGIQNESLWLGKTNAINIFRLNWELISSHQLQLHSRLVVKCLPSYCSIHSMCIKQPTTVITSNRYQCSQMVTHIAHFVQQITICHTYIMLNAVDVLLDSINLFTAHRTSRKLKTLKDLRFCSFFSLLAVLLTFLDNRLIYA